MKIAINRGDADTAALDKITGTVSVGSHWIETFVIPDGKITGADTFDWQFNFRSSRDISSNDLSLTTGGGGLTVSQGSSTTTVGINVAATVISALSGDYFADLIYEDDDGEIIHQAHGKITFRNEPIWA